MKMNMQPPEMLEKREVCCRLRSADCGCLWCYQATAVKQESTWRLAHILLSRSSSTVSFDLAYRPARIQPGRWGSFVATLQPEGPFISLPRSCYLWPFVFRQRLTVLVENWKNKFSVLNEKCKKILCFRWCFFGCVWGGLHSSHRETGRWRWATKGWGPR